LKKRTKILLSIPSVISLLLFVVIVFPFLNFKVFPTMGSYNIVTYSVFLITLIQLIYLIRYLWKIDSIDKKVKIDWTVLMIIFSQIASLIFIWKKVDEFENQKEL
jgi:hypothetical protein